VPVFGLRPILRPFLSTMKEPNDDNLYHISLIRTHEPTGVIRWT
jgi:hypothetical protein